MGAMSSPPLAHTLEFETFSVADPWARLTEIGNLDEGPLGATGTPGAWGPLGIPWDPLESLW